MANYAYDLPVGNNWHWGFKAEFRQNAFADVQLSTGVVGLHVFVSASNKNPVALDPNLDVTPTEVSPGKYSITLYGVDTLRVLGANYVGRVVYLCIVLGTELLGIVPVRVTLAQLP